MITFGYRDNAVPFAYKDREGRVQGYSVELCTRDAGSIQKEVGLSQLKIEWVPVEASNRLDYVVDGKVDAVCGTTTITLAPGTEGLTGSLHVYFPPDQVNYVTLPDDGGVPVRFTRFPDPSFGLVVTYRYTAGAWVRLWTNHENNATQVIFYSPEDNPGGSWTEGHCITSIAHLLLAHRGNLLLLQGSDKNFQAFIGPAYKPSL